MDFLSNHPGALGCNLRYLLAEPGLKFKMFLLDRGITDCSYTVNVKIQVYSASIWNYNIESHVLKINSLCKPYKQQYHAKIFIEKKKRLTLRKHFHFTEKYILVKFNNLHKSYILRLVNLYIAFPSFSTEEI